MNGRQVSLAGHRFRAVADPRIRGMDCGDTGASDEPRSAEGRAGLVDTVRPRRGCDQIESEQPEWCRWEAQPTPARLADGLVRLVASATGFEPRCQPNRSTRSWTESSAN
jgi:hypothetical protein